MRCVICGENCAGCVCGRCGMDLSQCRELFPTLSVDRRKTEAVWVRRNRIYLGFLRAEAGKAAPKSGAAAAGSGTAAKPAAGAAGTGTAQKSGKSAAGTLAGTAASTAKTAQSSARSSASPKKPAGSGTAGPTVELPKYPTQLAPNDPELFKFRKLSDDSCELTGLKAAYTGRLVIPSRIQGMQVVGIAEKAFMGRTGLKTVVVPSKVRNVGRFAFYGCKYLKGVQLPNIANLEHLCFGGCSGLELVAVYPSGPSEQDGTIAENAFFEQSGTLWFRAPRNSRAAAYAQRKNYHLLP